MATLSRWSDFLTVVGSFLTTENPLNSQEQAALALHGQVANSAIHQSFPKSGVETMQYIAAAAMVARRLS
jgi:hypothetical protein